MLSVQELIQGVPVYVVSEGSFRHCKLQSFPGGRDGDDMPQTPAPLLSLSPRTLEIADPVPFLVLGKMPILQKKKHIVVSPLKVMFGKGSPG